MRPHGRASISLTRPRALGICQRCGAMYNRDQLEWQYEYGGPRLINLRVLVCKTCYDKPQAQLRTILLPPDPVSIEFPSQEIYTADDNPMSPVGFNPYDLTATIQSTFSVNFGTMKYGGGVNAAFDGYINKPTDRCATIVFSSSSAGYTNTVGKFWGAEMRAPTAPSSIQQAPITYNISAFRIYGPIDSPIIAPAFSGAFDPVVFDPVVFSVASSGSVATTGVQLQGSHDGINWTVLYSTTTSSAVAQVLTSISSNLTTGDYEYHQIAFNGTGNQISVAQVQFDVSNTGQNEQ